MFFSKRPSTKDSKTVAAEATIRSVISDKLLLSTTQWAVSLVGKKGYTDKTKDHAFLVIEGKKADEAVILRTDLFLDQSHRAEIVKNLPSQIAEAIDTLWSFSQNMGGRAFIRIKELNIDELYTIAGTHAYQSWGITSEQAETLLARILVEVNDRKKTYNITGDHSSSSSSYSHSNYHNCISWCQMILEEALEITIGDKWDLIKRPSQIVQETIKAEQAKSASSKSKYTL